MVVKAPEKLDFRLKILKSTLRLELMDLINKIGQNKIDLDQAKMILKRISTEINAGIPKAKKEEEISEFFRISNLAQNLNGVSLEHLLSMLVNILRNIDLEKIKEKWTEN